MKHAVTEYRYDWRTGNTNPYHHFVIDKPDMKAVFKSMYANERSARYCSDVSYKFDNPVTDAEYRKWKETGVTIELFYGGGTVD